MQSVLLGNNKHENGLDENKGKWGGRRRRERINNRYELFLLSLVPSTSSHRRQCAVRREVVGWGWNNQHSTQTASLIITLIWHGSSWAIIHSRMTFLTPSSLILVMQNERKKSAMPFLLCYELIISPFTFLYHLLLSTLNEWRIVSFAARFYSLI